MRFSNLLAAIPLIAGICSAKIHHIRAINAQDNATLFAYGTNISGLALAYGNTDGEIPSSINPLCADSLLGLAYIISAPTANFSSLTMDITNSGDVAWNGTINNSTSVGSFYIIDSGFTQAGFVSSNATVANASTIGFSMFGGQVVYVDSSGNYLSQFWAQTTSTDGVWSLLWNTDGTSQTDSVPVTIKTISIAS